MKTIFTLLFLWAVFSAGQGFERAKMRNCQTGSRLRDLNPAFQGACGVAVNMK